MSTATDHDLLSAWATSRDERAFSALVERYARMVAATCRRAGAAGADIDDSAQETFAALARDAGAVRGRVGAWLHVVARRQASRALARRAPSATIVEPAADPPQPDLDDALALLPPEESEVVRRAYLRDDTQERIAADLRLSQPTVHRRLGSGLARLRRLLVPCLALAGGGLLRRAPGALRAAAASAVAITALGVAGMATHADPPVGIDITDLPRLMAMAVGWYAVIGIVAGVVEVAAWRRTLVCGPWIGAALCAAVALKYQERLHLYVFREQFPDLMFGGWRWDAAVAVGVVALIAYARDIASTRAGAGRWAVARWAAAILALAALVDAAADAHGFVGRPTATELAQEFAAKQAARDAEATARDGLIREHRVVDGHPVHLLRRPQDPSPSDDELRERYRAQWAR